MEYITRASRVTYFDIKTIIFYITIVIVAVFFMYLYQKKDKENKKGKKIYLILSFLFLWLPIGFRYWVGSDYPSYINMYLNIGKLNFFKDVLFSDFEVFYKILEFIIYFIFKDRYQFLFLITSFISLFFVYKSILNKKDILSIAVSLLFFSSFYYFRAFTMVRQALAYSILLYAYSLIDEDGKILKYSIWVSIASLFHFSAIIGFIAIPVIKMKKLNLIKTIIITVICIIILLFIEPLSNVIFTNDRYSGYEMADIEFGIGMLALRLPLILLMLLYRKRLKKFFKNTDIYFGILLCDLVLSQVAYIATFSPDRLSMNLSIVKCFVLPILLKVAPKKEKLFILIYILFEVIYYFYLSMSFGYMMPYYVSPILINKI